MSRLTTYEQWFIAQPPGYSFPRTLDEVELLARDVARNGSECDSSAETLALVVDGLLAELRERRAADLSDEERGALHVLVADMKRSEMRSPDIMYYPPHLLEVRRVLDRLLNHAGGDK